MSRIGTGPGPFFISSEIETTENGGSETAETWQGSESECRNQINLLRAQGATRLRLTSGPGGDWQARGSFPFGDDPAEKPVDSMELDINVINRSIYQSPIYRSRFSDFDASSGGSAAADATLGIIASCVAKYQREWADKDFTYNVLVHAPPAPAGNRFASKEEAILSELVYRLNSLVIAVYAAGTVIPRNLTANEFTSAGQLFGHIAFRGATSFLEYQQVFRRTVTAGSPAAVRANYEGAGKIWTTAEVTTWEGIPADGWFVLPTGVQWHKDKPSVLKAYGQKTQLTYHYTEIKTASALTYEKYGSAILLDTIAA